MYFTLRKKNTVSYIVCFAEMIALNTSFVTTAVLRTNNRTLIATHFTNFSLKLLGDTIFITPTLKAEGVVVKALRYKTTGRGFDSRWCHWNFSVT
jgi:hypothetical protein